MPEIKVESVVKSAAGGLAVAHADRALAARILVVDDNEANRDALSRRLHRVGYDVDMAAEGLAALKMIETGVYDLVLLDVMMPGISGMQVLAEVRRRFDATALPIVMVTAKDEGTDIAAALNEGANDYITKPLDFVVVQARVRTQLSLKRHMQAVESLQRDLQHRNAALEEMNKRLETAYGRMRKDLATAARLQKAFLPSVALKIRQIQFSWYYKPCDQLAGDFLNICPIDETHVGFYILDVSGHGVAASLLAVAAARALAPPRDPNSLLVQNNTQNGETEPARPADVLSRLHQNLFHEPNDEQFLTIFYVLLDLNNHTLTYASAGHPGAVLIKPAGEMAILDQSGLPVGIGEQYEQFEIPFTPGDRLYLYSDGITEMANAAHEMFGIERLKRNVQEARKIELAQSVNDLIGQADRWRGNAANHDDVSLLGIEAL